MIFKRIVSRENGTPWTVIGMSTEQWHSIPVQEVVISELIAMQDGVFFHALEEDYVHWHDEYPHVIVWQGELYLEDGHHRVMKALLRGQKKVLARVLGL